MTKRFQILVGCFLFVLGSSFSTVSEPMDHKPTIEVIAAAADKGPLGVWGYEVEGMEDAYRKGVLFVRQEGGTFIVEVHLGNGVLNGYDVQVEGDTLKFMVNVEGTDRVSVVLKSSSDTMLGEVSTSQGSFNIKCIRKLPPM